MDKASWNPRTENALQSWGLHISHGCLVLFVSLRLDTLLLRHLSSEMLRRRGARSDKRSQANRSLGFGGVLQRIHRADRIEYSVELTALNQSVCNALAHTLSIVFRFIDALQNEEVAMDGRTNQRYWVENLQVAHLASTLSVTVTPAMANYIATMPESSFQITRRVIEQVQMVASQPRSSPTLRVERSVDGSPLSIYIDSDCCCFTAERSIGENEGYSMHSHNFRLAEHHVAILAALAHLSTCYDNSTTC